MFDYDAFASYATDPDGDLVRASEAFIEGFHLRRSLPAVLQRELELCVDGRDFKIPRRPRTPVRPVNEIADIVQTYMRRCRSLIVFSGPLSKDHPWINHEVRWWLHNRPDSPIYFALTHGAPASVEDCMPPALLEGGGGDLVIFFDLREFHVTARSWRINAAARRRVAMLRESIVKWRSVRPFAEEMSKLVARLLADALGGEISVSEIEQAWAADERRSRLKRRAYGVAACITAAAAGTMLLDFSRSARLAEQDARADAWLQHARVLLDRGGAALPDALAYTGSALIQRPNANAIGVAYQVLDELVPIERIIKPGGGDPAWTAEFLNDSGLVVTGGRSSKLRLIDVRDGGLLAEIDLRAASIRTIAYDVGSHTLFVGTDRGLRRVEVRREGGKVTLAETGQALSASRVGGLAIDSGRSRILVGLLSGEIWSFSLGRGSALSGNRVIQIMDPRSNTDGPPDIPSSVYGLSLRGHRLVATGIDGVVSVFDDVGQLSAPRQFVHSESIFAMAVSHTGRELAVADQKGGLAIYDLETLSLRRNEVHPPESSSVARSIAGSLDAAVIDKLANVGLAISPDDAMLAVTSHDRSVRFLSFNELAPVGSVVHGAAPRAVLFEANGKRAITFSDDGSIQIVRPYAQPELLRLAGVAGLAAYSGEDIVFWPGAPARTGPTRSKGAEAATPVLALAMSRLDDPDARRKIGEITDVPMEGRIVGDRVALRTAGSTRVALLPLAGATLACATLQHSNEAEQVDIVQKLVGGTAKDSLVTVASRLGGSGTSLQLWDLVSCTATSVWPSSLSGTVAVDAAVLIPTGRRVEIHRLHDSRIQSIDFDQKVAGVDASAHAEVVVVRFDASSSLCVCSRKDLNTTRQSQPEQCAARTTDYGCVRPDLRLPGEKEMPVVQASHISMLGKYAVVQAGPFLRYLDAASGWKVRRANPDQLRGLEQPYAFDAQESLLEVPSGETGVRVLEAANGKILAELPTPSRVNQIMFFSDPSGAARLATLDGSVLRIWDWRRSYVLERLCERWNPELKVETWLDTAAPLPRSAICGPHDNTSPRMH
jgi:WD40 repeat protein